MNYTIPNITSPIDLFNAGNAVTGGMWGYTIVFLTWIIMFTILKFYGNDTRDSVIASAFITVTITILLSVVGTVPIETIVIPIAIAIGSLIIPRRDM